MIWPHWGAMSAQTLIYTEYPIKTIIYYLCDIGVYKADILITRCKLLW